jgi:small-conductance mechanosensitive channel
MDRLNDLGVFFQMIVIVYGFIHFISKMSSNLHDPEVIPKKLIRVFVILMQSITVFVGIYFAFEIIGVKETIVSTVLGAIFGVGFSFAIRDNISNFIAGFIILFLPTYAEGMTIQIQYPINVIGEIVELSSQHTRLRTTENGKIKFILIPNLMLYNTIIVIHP